MPAVGWTAIEDALHAWAVAGTALAATSVIWTYQGGPRPAPPYLALQLTDVRPVGWASREEEDAGEEIKLIHRLPHTATLELQLFADKSTNPVARLHDAIAALDIPDHIDALDAAGVGIGESGPIRLVAGRVNTLLEPRAVGEVTLHIESVVESFVDYIARVTGTIELDDEAQPLDVELETEEES